MPAGSVVVRPAEVLAATQKSVTQSRHLAERDRIEHELAVATSRPGPDYWLVRAEEARAMAAQLAEPSCKKFMNGIADGYEAMAEAAKRLEKSYAVLGESKSAQ